MNTCPTKALQSGLKASFKGDEKCLFITSKNEAFLGSLCRREIIDFFTFNGVEEKCSFLTFQNKACFIWKINFLKRRTIKTRTKLSLSCLAKNFITTFIAFKKQQVNNCSTKALQSGLNTSFKRGWRWCRFITSKTGLFLGHWG